EDRRIVLVELTGKGKDLHDLFGTKKVELGHLVLNQLNKEERQNFIGLLNKVKQGVAKPL
ncbi:MAG: hypothetical protein AAF519_12065, partial [Bacteroidota bacterium]